MRLSVTLIISIFIFSACTNSHNTVQHEPEVNCLQQEYKKDISIETISMVPVTERVHLMGGVETNPDKVLEYVSLVRGLVSAVNFSLGDAVTKGQVLAEIRSTELSALQSQSSSIEAEIQSARRNLEAVRSMHEDKLASDRDLEEAKSRLQMLQSEKNRTKSDLSLYGADIGKGVFQIKAPASGIITTKSINTGMQISDESGVLFTIASLDNVWIMANVYATNLGSIEQGMPVEITTLSYPDLIFKGKISVLSPVMDEHEKVLKARIELDNTGYKLKPGMVVDVMALKQTEKRAIAIPIDAIVFSDNENYVLDYKDDCHIEIRKIHPIAKNDREYYIQDELKQGDRIVAKNPLLIFEQIRNLNL